MPIGQHTRLPGPGKIAHTGEATNSGRWAPLTTTRGFIRRGIPMFFAVNGLANCWPSGRNGLTQSSLAAPGGKTVRHVTQACAGGYRHHRRRRKKICFSASICGWADSTRMNCARGAGCGKQQRDMSPILQEERSAYHDNPLFIQLDHSRYCSATLTHSSIVVPSLKSTSFQRDKIRFALLLK